MLQESTPLAVSSETPSGSRAPDSMGFSRSQPTGQGLPGQGAGPGNDKWGTDGNKHDRDRPYLAKTMDDDPGKDALIAPEPAQDPRFDFKPGAPGPTT
jgi:hypothetical protein